MKKDEDLSIKKGTIASVLTQHKDEIYALINSNQYQQLQNKINELLNDSSLKQNPATQEARMTLMRCARNQNLYYSTLMTYMTGMKVM